MGTMIVSLNDRETQKELRDHFGKQKTWKDWWTPQWIVRDLCKQHGITLNKVSIGYVDEDVDPISAKLICSGIIAVVEMDIEALSELAEIKYEEFNETPSHGRYSTSIMSRVNLQIRAKNLFTLVKTGNAADRRKNKDFEDADIVFADECNVGDIVWLDGDEWNLLKEIHDSGKAAFIASKLDGGKVVDYAVFRKLPNNRWPFKAAA